MEYKNTLNLPNTAFPMKANLSQNEPHILESWQAGQTYAKIREKYKGSPKYILHDGPPYANGNIHIGHALNKILKDIIIRFKTMQGFDSAYIPGWDCHGLPVEHQLFKELNITKDQIQQLDFRNKAYNYALKFVEVQKKEFIRLGVFGSWDKPYLTLNKGYEYQIVTALCELLKKGFIYHGLKPVNWCASCETALAEAEVEYEDMVSPSIYVKFKLKGQQALPAIKNHFEEDVYLVIWTTTPWTLYGNTAVAVHKDMQYAFVKTPKGVLVIAKPLLAAALNDLSMAQDSVSEAASVKGKDLEGLVYEHPFLDDDIVRKVVLADYVSCEEGVGLVHTAPGHGQEDYLTGLKYNLPILMPVDTRGRFDGTVYEFQGINVLDANKQIIKNLETLGSLLFFSQKSHSYPHCWRCKNPVIFRATKQWFLNMEHDNLRHKLISSIENEVRWVPETGKERIKSMVALRPDWCLSRQRYWGVPIPSVLCQDCLEEVLSVELTEKFARKVLEEGSDTWFKSDINELLPEGFKCPSCGGKRIKKGNDILDVWFDSGTSYRSVLKAQERTGEGLGFPAALYLEGSDQHRGWFQASLIPSVAIEGSAPFKSVLTHGFVVDGEGRKMSKSQGNVIAPQEIIKEYGADILRLWVASSNYSEDIRISRDIILRLTDAYRKIRNTIRFMLANLHDFNPDTDTVAYDSMLPVERFSLSVSYRLFKKITGYYNEFEFYKIYQEIYQFCISQLSNFYLDVLKDRLYTAKDDSLKRRSAQSAMYEILLLLVKSIAPILPFTAEEIWQHLFKDRVHESVHLAQWPQIKDKYIDDELEDRWYNLILFRAKVLKALEEKRAKADIGSSLEAGLTIGLCAENSFLKDFGDILPEIFIVSSVSMEDAQEPYVKVTKAQGRKCLRCWNYSELTGQSREYPDICPKCVEALT